VFSNSGLQENSLDISELATDPVSLVLMDKHEDTVKAPLFWIFWAFGQACLGSGRALRMSDADRKTRSVSQAYNVPDL
jgi:hypothetical protein